MTRRASVFVQQPIPDGALASLRAIARVDVFEETARRISVPETIERVRDVDYIFALGENPITADVIDAATRLRMIASMEIFPTQIDLQAATSRGIPVTGLPHDDEIAETTAEYTVALMLSVAWGIPRADSHLRAGRWSQYQSVALPARRVRGKKLGIVGLGKVGRGVAQRARALGMQVCYYDLNRDIETEEALGVSWKPLLELARDADFVVVSVLLTEGTVGLFGADLLGCLKPGSILINTSRGRVLDEEALADALASGHLASAGLDVYQREIPQPNPGPAPRLLDFDHIVLTPHIGTSAVETRLWMAEHVVGCIASDLRGERPTPILNPEVFGERSLTTSRIG